MTFGEKPPLDSGSTKPDVSSESHGSTHTRISKLEQSLSECDFCSLPLAASAGKTTARHKKPGAEQDVNTQSESPQFCCVGCSIASSVTGSKGAEGQARWMLARLGLGIFFTMNVSVFTLVLWSQDVYAQPDELDSFAVTLWSLFRHLGLLFSLPVLFLLGGPILESVLQSARRKAITTDWLILLGVVAAFVYSAFTTFRGEGHVYYEVGCIVLVMVTLGRWLEAVGKHKTGEALDSLTQLLPEKVHRLQDNRQEDVPREEAAVDDLLRVLPGERFAIDGIIVRGAAEIDEQILSGESNTLTKETGDFVFSGTLNVDGDLHVRVTAASGEETVSRLVELVRQSRQMAGNYQRLADRVAFWFVPAVGVFSLACAAWYGVNAGVEQGVLAGLSIVLIACPCALGLATPMAIWSAMGLAAKRQVLFRSAESLERLATVSAIRLDKTGTLTVGSVSVETCTVTPTTSKIEYLKVAQFVAEASNHIYSVAIRRYVQKQIKGQSSHVEKELLKHSNVETIGGRGLLIADVDGFSSLVLGNLQHMQEQGLQLGPQLQQEVDFNVQHGKSFTLLGWNEKVEGLFTFGERLRPEATDAIARFKKMGLDIAVLTGDHCGRAALLSQTLGIPFAAEQNPQDKVQAVKKAQQEFGAVAMVGDGINDAPALAAADVGIAMGCGADLSRDAADVCLLTDNLLRLEWAMRFSRRVVRTIRQNLFWAFAYNIIGIGIAATGRLNPIWAAAAMTLSSLFVVSNSLKLSKLSQEEKAIAAGPVPSQTNNISEVIDKNMHKKGMTP